MTLGGLPDVGGLDGLTVWAMRVLWLASQSGLVAEGDPGDLAGLDCQDPKVVCPLGSYDF